MSKLRIALIFAAASSCFLAHRQANGHGTLRVTITDQDTKRETPARVTIRDSAGNYFAPDSALAVFSDCTTMPLHNWVPAAAAWQASRTETRRVRNPSRGTLDFYTTGAFSLQLSPGRYSIRIEKGPEYTIIDRVVEIAGSTEHAVETVMRRWINMPDRGWFSSDDHLHIPRPAARLDPIIGAWMQAEDLHVANLLQMGMARDVHLTPQRAFGAESVYQTGNTMLIGGQESPRTHVLGHGIVLGPKRWIDFPQAYLLYPLLWQEARRQGALPGYAHFAVAGAADGMALWGHTNPIDFIEVLNIGFPFYEPWYDGLNAGERIVPTAGTDYPCVANLPGHERFYTQIDGPLSFPAWTEAVRLGRTFVTNGPVVAMEINGAGIGSEVALQAPATVHVSARARFDLSRDRVDRLELIRAGEVVASARPSAVGEVAIDVSLPVQASTWVAARVSGEKVNEKPAEPVDGFVAYVSSLGRKADKNVAEDLKRVGRPGQTRESAAHTAPIYITVAGTPSIGEQAPARRVAAKRLAVLDDLAGRLEESRAHKMARFPGFGDGITVDDLQRARGQLLRDLETAREHYRAILR